MFHRFTCQTPNTKNQIHDKFDPSKLSFTIELFKVLFPFHGQQLFFIVVAFFAAGHHVASGAFTAAGYGHDVIHGQVLGSKRPAAIITGPFCQPAFPPLGFTQGSGPVTLTFLIVRTQIIGEGLYIMLSLHFGIWRFRKMANFCVAL